MTPITAADVLRDYSFTVSKELANWIDRSVEEVMPEWCLKLARRYPTNSVVSWIVRTFSGVEIRMQQKTGSFSRVYQVCSWGTVVAQLEVQ